MSSIEALLKNDVWLIPIGTNLDGYRTLFRDGAIIRAYYNTLWYTVVGTSINLLMTLTAAFALSRRWYSLRNPIMIMIAITMFFNGGMIPSFILIRQ